MSSTIPAMQWNVTYLVNLVVLGLLINSFYYFGLRGAVITLLLIGFLAPLSNENILETDTVEEN